MAACHSWPSGRASQMFITTLLSTQQAHIMLFCKLQFIKIKLYKKSAVYNKYKEYTVA
jgi:hypothetical protein